MGSVDRPTASMLTLPMFEEATILRSKLSISILVFADEPHYVVQCLCYLPNILWRHFVAAVTLVVEKVEHTKWMHVFGPILGPKRMHRKR
eukprot:6212923-Pleurochrysis_carterae.AAC.1